MTSAWGSLLRSRAFWMAIFALVQTVLFELVPNFPDAVWQSINLVVAVVIAKMAVEDGAEKLSRGRDVVNAPAVVVNPPAGSGDVQTREQA